MTNIVPVAVSAPAPVAAVNDGATVAASAPGAARADIQPNDQQFFDSFAQGLSAVTRDPKVLQYAIDWYYKFGRESTAQLEALHASDRSSLARTLSGEWGASYKQNLTAISAYLDSLPPAVTRAIETATLDNGSLLLNTQDGLRWLLSLAQKAPANDAAEIAEIERILRTDRSRYNRDESLQRRYHTLLGRPGAGHRKTAP